MDDSTHLDISSSPNKLQYMNYIRENFSNFTTPDSNLSSNLYSSVKYNKLHYYSTTKNLITKKCISEYPTALANAIASPQKTALYLSEIHHALISTPSHVYIWNVLNPSNQGSLHCFPASSEVLHCAISSVKLGIFGSSIKKLLTTIDAKNKLTFYLLQYNNNINNSAGLNVENAYKNLSTEIPSNIIRSDFNLNLEFSATTLFAKDKEIYILDDKLDVYEIEYFSSNSYKHNKNCNTTRHSNNNAEIDSLNILNSDLNIETSSYISYNLIKHTNNFMGKLESFYNYISTPKKAKTNSITNTNTKVNSKLVVIDCFIDKSNEVYVLYKNNTRFHINIYQISNSRAFLSLFKRQKVKQINSIDITKNLIASSPIKISSPSQANYNNKENKENNNNKENKVKAIVVTDKGDRLLFGHVNNPLLLGYSFTTSFSFIKTIPCNTIHNEYNALNSTIFPEENEDGIRRLQNDAVYNDQMLLNSTNKHLVTISNDLFTIVFNDTNKLHVYKFDTEFQVQNETFANNNKHSSDIESYRHKPSPNIIPQTLPNIPHNNTNNIEIELADFNNVPSSFLSFTLPSSNTLNIFTIEGLLYYSVNSLLTEAKQKLTESFEQNNFEELFKNERYLTSLFLSVTLPQKEKYAKLFPSESPDSNLKALQNSKDKGSSSHNNNRLVSAYNKNISFTSHDFSYSEIIGNIYSNKVVDKTNTQLKNLLGGLLEGIEFKGIKEQINKKIEVAFIKCLTMVLKDVFKKSLFSLITNTKYSSILKEIETNVYNLPLNYWISLPANLRVLVETIKEIILVLCFISDYNVKEPDVLYARLTPLKNALDSLNTNEKSYLKDILFYHLITSYKSQKLIAKLFENYIYCLEQDFILFSQYDTNSEYNSNYNNTVGRAYEVSRELGVLEKERRIKAAKCVIKEFPHLFSKNVTVKNEYIAKLEECLGLKGKQTNELELYSLLDEILLNNNQESTFNEKLMKEATNLLVKNEIYSACFYFVLKVYRIHYSLRTINTLALLTPFQPANTNSNKSNNTNNNKESKRDAHDKGNESYQREIDICIENLLKQKDYTTIIKNITSYNNTINITTNNSLEQLKSKRNVTDKLEIVKPIEYILNKLFVDFNHSFEIVKLCLQKTEFNKTLKIIELFLIKENKEKELCVIYTELGLHIKAALIRDKRASSNYNEINIKERLDLLYKANSNLSILQHNNQFNGSLNDYNEEECSVDDFKSFKELIAAKIKTAHLQQEIVSYSDNYEFMSNVYNVQKVNNLFKRCREYLISTDELYSVFEELGKFEGCVLIHEITNNFKYNEIEKVIEKIKETEVKKGSLNSTYNWKWNFKKRIIGIIPRLKKKIIDA
eukprot:GAHX01001468.1.p1 GENE.GAHX01001468.1~~GAHX01001468.1.p1  ORF type:complete len:1365 (-),score=336.35 GAHX01001468.1:159-4208(-)